MPERSEMPARLRGLYADYCAKVAQLERERKPGAGIFGMKGGPADDPCHERFAEDLRVLLESFGAARPSGGELRDVLAWIYDAPQRDRAPKCAYWMLVAVQGLTRPLLGDLAPEDAAALRRQLEKAYPRYARMPVQNELLRELKAAER